ncbi:MAG TPA: hypothetical protein VFJ98_04140, partial [Mycobacteriales bacterium]|nr:hypothetical protein [Mycobacteriales bacterium]
MTGGERTTTVAWRSYALVLAGAVACYCALGAVLGVLPDYVAHGLGANPTWVGITLGAPALTGAALRPTGGRLADRHGPYAGLAIGPLVAVPLGGARHPVAVWFVALALPLVAAAAVRRSRLPVV